MTDRLPQVLPKKTFCLIRHGETTANRDLIIAGRLDVSLTKTGRAQAKALQALKWPTAYRLFTSPMQRAQDTCALGFPTQAFHTHPGLRERDWGIFEGQPLAKLPKREGRPEQGEDWAEMIDRVAATLHDCCALAEGTLPILICHSGVIRATRILVGQNTSGQRPANAHPIHFKWNGTSHQETVHDV